MIFRDARHVVRMNIDEKLYVRLFVDIIMFGSCLDRQVRLNRTCDCLRWSERRYLQSAAYDPVS